MKNKKLLEEATIALWAYQLALMGEVGYRELEEMEMDRGICNLSNWMGFYNLNNSCFEDFLFSVMCPTPKQLHDWQISDISKALQPRINWLTNLINKLEKENQ